MSIFSSVVGASISQRDVNERLFQVIQNEPSLFGLINRKSIINNPSINIMDPFSNPNKATNTTIEWFENTLSPKKATLTAAAGTGTTFTVADSSIFKVDDILRIEKSNGKEIPEQVLITAIPTGTTLTVSRGYDGSSPVNLADGNEIIFLINNLKSEGGPRASAERVIPVAKSNYTEIFKASGRITGTELAVKNYAVNDILLFELQQAFLRMIREIDNRLIFGKKNNSNPEKRQLGGLREFVDGASNGNIKDASDGAITQSMFDDIFEEMIDRGAMEKDLLVLCHTKQSRKISNLAINGANPIVYKAYSNDLQEGQAVSRINSSIADGTSGQVMVYNNLPKDKVYIVDVSKVIPKPMRFSPFKEIETENDEFLTQMITELTFEFPNAEVSHGLIKNLQV